MKAFVSRIARKLPVALWLMFQISSLAADVGFVAVLKGQEFHQTSADIVALGDWRAWNDSGEVQNEGEHPEPLQMFEVYAFGTALDSIVSGSVTVPGGGVVPLVNDFRGNEYLGEIGVENGYETPLDLNTTRPDGIYTVALVTKNEGTHITNLVLDGDNYPSVPRITNSVALQTVSAGLAIPVQWQAMDGGTASDFIHVRIRQIGGMDDGAMLWQSGMPGQPGALNGLSAEAVIPPNTLAAGTDYLAEVMFVKTVDVLQGTSLEIAGYYKLTGLRIHTYAPAGTPIGAEFLRACPRDTWDPSAVNSAVAFQFSRPMNPGYHSASWTSNGLPLSTGPISYQWIQNNSVLLCVFSTNLPTGSEIGWTLDLTGFRDLRGFPLSGTASGSFHTRTDGTPGTPDVEFISMLKTRFFRQPGTTLVPDGRYEAMVAMDTTAANRVKSASATATANGRNGPLYVDPWNGTEYETPGEYASKSDLDRFYPNGSYQITLDSLADGPQSITLDLGANDWYPEAPTITNLAALQAVDPAAPVTVTWNALPGWTNNIQTLGPGGGWIEFEILDRNDQEVLWVEGMEMTNGVSWVIPAGTLAPGRSYQANLYFLRITDVDQTSYPDAFAVAAFESVTRFTIQTTGQPVMPVLALQRLGGTARINASGGELNLPYALEVSHNLQRWTPLERYWNGGVTHQYDDADAQYLKARFYRVRDSLISEVVIPHIAIQGTVWTNSSRTSPVAGAVVGTSLDGQTTITDAQGLFYLMTDTPSQNGGALYTITVSAGAQNRSFGPWNWGDQPRNQNFEMN
jgi:hypothetical protein